MTAAKIIPIPLPEDPVRDWRTQLRDLRATERALADAERELARPEREKATRRWRL